MMRKEGGIVMAVHCNLGKSWYCPITDEICDPVQNCPLARKQAEMEQEGIPADNQKDGPKRG